MGSSGEEDLELGATPDPGAGGGRLTRAPVRVQSEPELVHITVLEVFFSCFSSRQKLLQDEDCPPHKGSSQRVQPEERGVPFLVLVLLVHITVLEDFPLLFLSSKKSK